MRFELNNLPRNCSDEDIISEIKRVDSIVGKNILTIVDYDKHGKMSSSAIRNRFGGWHKALIAANLGEKYFGTNISEKMRAQKSRQLPDEAILDELKRIAKFLNSKTVTIEDVKSHSAIMSEAVVRRRFGSWAAALEKAGLNISEFYRRPYSDEEYFENMLNVWTSRGKQPLYREMDEPPSTISSGAYEGRFGSWRKALEVFVARMNKDEPAESSENSSIVAEPTSDSQSIEKTAKAEPSKATHSLQHAGPENRRGIGLALRYKILSRDKFRCVNCGTSPATDVTCRLHVDHITPFSKGGKTVMENLQTLCATCNLGKGNLHLA